MNLFVCSELVSQNVSKMSNYSKMAVISSFFFVGDGGGGPIPSVTQKLFFIFYFLFLTFLTLFGISSIWTEHKCFKMSPVYPKLSLETPPNSLQMLKKMQLRNSQFGLGNYISKGTEDVSHLKVFFKNIFKLF